MVDTTDTDRKAALLSKYAKRVPKEFVQYDGWLDAYGDSVMHPDGDGDAMMSLHTFELMYGTDCRVLIPVGADGLATARLLRKIAAWIELEGLLPGNPSMPGEGAVVAVYSGD